MVIQWEGASRRFKIPTVKGGDEEEEGEGEGVQGKREELDGAEAGLKQQPASSLRLQARRSRGKEEGRRKEEGGGERENGKVPKSLPVFQQETTSRKRSLLFLFWGEGIHNMLSLKLPLRYPHQILWSLDFQPTSDPCSAFASPQQPYKNLLHFPMRMPRVSSWTIYPQLLLCLPYLAAGYQSKGLKNST